MVVVVSVSVSLSAMERQARFSVFIGARRRTGRVLKIPPSSSGERAGSGWPLGAGVGVWGSPEVVAILIAVSDLIGYQMNYFCDAKCQGLADGVISPGWRRVFVVPVAGGDQG